ncbi:MFS general substrate transporter [Xylona heveae TC161]|uniref:MFS general substrate transporter n=1 Tax=Xylona heveae (strain CBS 132557 / TC161) TaxID=1328760 RepID=A0A165GBA2_XYLHT|nr:MFS general substrate transporter [Xylona heveae TC161]KZF21981.1 MFS general substrate transporter [Xylona heveae TC161]
MAHQYRIVTNTEPEKDPLNNENHEKFDRRMPMSLSKWQLTCLTISMGGLQVTWVTIMAEGSPFLLSLGLAPSLISLVWLAGPICGTVLQPFLGYKSDACTHKWGRRKPFIFYGTIGGIVSMNLLAWTKEIIWLICYILSVDPYALGPTLITKILAIACIWALNVSLQPVQVGLRSLTVDSCPPSQQVTASSFTSCIVILGSIIGYGCGFLKMPIPNITGWIENSQFKGLCLLASILLGLTVAITLTTTRENSPATDYPLLKKVGFRQIFPEIYKTTRSLPRKIKMVFEQTFILIAKMGPPSTRFYNALHEQSLRHGTLALLLFSCVALVTNIGLPYMVRQEISNTTSQFVRKEKRSCARMGTYMSISRAWMSSHVLMSVCLFGLTVGDSFISSVVFVALLGVCWGLTQWAPFAIIGEEIATDPKPNISSHCISEPPSPRRQYFDDNRDVESKDYDHQQGNIKSMAATAMGVHNIAIAMPQMVSAVTSSLIFGISGPSHLGPVEALAWILRVGVVAGACTAYLARRIE